MNKEHALQLIWDYMHLHHTLKHADAIVVLGCRDTRVAVHAATLFLNGYAPIMLFSGSGSIHNHKPGREQFAGSTEAEVFASIAVSMGVPRDHLLIENRSQNTGQNYEYSIQLLKEHGITPKTIIAVQKPYMERRTYATGKVWWPDVELIVTSPPIPIEEYPDHTNTAGEHWVHAMVGDLQRIREYPKQGFQIPQDIPQEVWDAYEYLVSLGYTNRLIAD